MIRVDCQGKGRFWIGRESWIDRIYRRAKWCESETNLGETNVGGLLTEALTADVHLYRVLARFRSHIAKRNILVGLYLRRTCGSDQRGGCRYGFKANKY